MKTTKQRLAQYRREVKSDKWIKPLTWRETRRHHKNLWYTPTATKGDKGQLFTESVDQIGDYLGDVHELFRRLNRVGWYADNYQDALLIGGVCRLRTSRGTLYIPVTHRNEWDVTHYMGDAVTVSRGSDQDNHDDAIRDTARLADRCAEIEAEESREYHAKDSAQQDIIEARERIHEINRAALVLLRDIKQHGAFSVAVCSALRAQVMSMLNERAEQFRIIRERERNYWSAVPNY